MEADFNHNCMRALYGEPCSVVSNWLHTHSVCGSVVSYMVTIGRPFLSLW